MKAASMRRRAFRCSTVTIASAAALLLRPLALAARAAGVQSIRLGDPAYPTRDDPQEITGPNSSAWRRCRASLR